MPSARITLFFNSPEEDREMEQLLELLRRTNNRPTRINRDERSFRNVIELEDQGELNLSAFRALFNDQRGRRRRADSAPLRFIESARRRAEIGVDYGSEDSTAWTVAAPGAQPDFSLEDLQETVSRFPLPRTRAVGTPPFIEPSYVTAPADRTAWVPNSMRSAHQISTMYEQGLLSQEYLINTLKLPVDLFPLASPQNLPPKAPPRSRFELMMDFDQ